MYADDQFRNRLTIASFFIAMVVLAVSTRMFQLSILQGEKISTLARKVQENYRQQQENYWNAPLKTAQGRLEEVIKNIENMTLGEIRSSILQAREFLEYLQAEHRENLRALSELRRKLAEERDQVSSLERQRKTLESLKDQDIEVLSYLLARDAQRDKWSSFLLGGLLSFPIGIAASLLANYLFSHLAGRKPNDQQSKHRT